MQFDTTSFAIGAVAGIVVAFILRLHVLKKLDLKLDRIGIDLGVEGFEKKEPPSGISFGDVSGTVGDVAGRDMHKNISQNSNFYKTVQAAAREAMKNALGEENGGNQQTLIQNTFRIESRTQDPQLIANLERIQRQSKRGMEEYVNEYAKSPEFVNQIRDEIRHIQSTGWTPTTIRPVDNLANGLLVEVVAVKPL